MYQTQKMLIKVLQLSNQKKLAVRNVALAWECIFRNQARHLHEADQSSLKISPFLPCLHLMPQGSFQEVYQVINSSSILSSGVRGSFFNYVDQIMSIIDLLPTPRLTLLKEFLILFHILRENLHTVDFSPYTYLPTSSIQYS